MRIGHLDFLTGFDIYPEFSSIPLYGDPEPSKRLILLSHIKVSMGNCLMCNADNAVIEKSEIYESVEYNGIIFCNLVLACKKCGWGGNCIMTKKHIYEPTTKTSV